MTRWERLLWRFGLYTRRAAVRSSAYALRHSPLFAAVCMVEAFHNKIEHTYDGPPRAGDLGAYGSRYEFALEELEEYLEACEEGDLEGILDAIIDQVYFALGTAYCHGFSARVVMEAFLRVHEANMLKEPDPYGRKAVKPEGWTPPDLSDLVKEGASGRGGDCTGPGGAGGTGVAVGAAHDGGGAHGSEAG